MKSLVAGPMAALRKGRTAAAFAEIDAIRARKAATEPDDPFAVADIDEAFGVLLFLEGDGDDRLQRASVPFLKRAISEYRDRLGATHPEVAVALHSYADVLASLDPRTNAREAHAAYCEAFRIRRQILGAKHAETGAALAALARLYPDSDAATAYQDLNTHAPPARVSVRTIKRTIISSLTLGLVDIRNDREEEAALLEAVARDPRFAALCADASAG